MHIRPIIKEDNIALAKVIREILAEHGVNRPGTVFNDPTTDALFELFQMKNSYYFVVKLENEILGGAGIYPTKGLPTGCAEFGFTSIYLETMPELSSAIGLYEKMGFCKLNKALGNSGHFACDLWMLKTMEQ
ncbi:MAG: N-acetyltransferase family protein [Flavobacteriales bacterium]